MRFLKRKVFKAQSSLILSKGSTPASDLFLEADDNDSSILKIKKTIEKSKSCPTTSPSSHSKASYNVKSTKNIVKNYGRAITSFVLSPLAQPYLEEIVKRDYNEVCIDKFLKYVYERRSDLDCMERLKRILTIVESDPHEEAFYKVLFKKIAEIFIKYFSVNWIFNSKLTYKQAHLDFRFKMLRRLQNPELFTYMKSFKKNI
jgi:hypothetical protein